MWITSPFFIIQNVIMFKAKFTTGQIQFKILSTLPLKFHVFYEKKIENRKQQFGNIVGPKQLSPKSPSV